MIRSTGSPIRTRCKTRRTLALTISKGPNDDIGKLNRKLERLAGQIRKPTEANRKASIALYGVVIRNFYQEGAMFGKWAPLDERTRREKARIGKEKILVRTGRLRAGFVPFHTQEQAGVRNAVIYAATHQYGDERRNIPARNMLPDRRTVIDIGLKVYGLYIGEKTREANR